MIFDSITKVLQKPMFAVDYGSSQWSAYPETPVCCHSHMVDPKHCIIAVERATQRSRALLPDGLELTTRPNQ